MDKTKRQRLEAKGWKVGTVAEFLELTPEESALIEIKLALSRKLRERRQEQMTQAELAARIHSSQPRIAKAENGDRSVSIELLLRAILATGATPQDIGETISDSALPDIRRASANGRTGMARITRKQA
jgi:DNA-binding XRE family transcriptional regulator